LATLAKEFSLWLHVDAAYGGFFTLCEEVREKFSGLSEADSIVLDPHKGLFLPYGCGAVLVKQGEQLRQAFDHQASYLQDRNNKNKEHNSEEQKSPMDYSLELTRPFRSLRIWLALKIHGEAIFTLALREKLLLAQYCRDQLAMIPHLHLMGNMDLTILAFRYENSATGKNGNEQTKALLQAINSEQKVFLSSTLIDGYFVIRVAILSFRTHLHTVDDLIHIVRTHAVT